MDLQRKAPRPPSGFRAQPNAELLMDSQCRYVWIQELGYRDLMFSNDDWWAPAVPIVISDELWAEVRRFKSCYQILKDGKINTPETDELAAEKAPFEEAIEILRRWREGLPLIPIADDFSWLRNSRAMIRWAVTTHDPPSNDLETRLFFLWLKHADGLPA